MGLIDGEGEKVTTPPPTELEEFASFGVALGCLAVMETQAAVRGLKEFTQALVSDVKDIVTKK